MDACRYGIQQAALSHGTYVPWSDLGAMASCAPPEERAGTHAQVSEVRVDGHNKVLKRVVVRDLFSLPAYR